MVWSLIGLRHLKSLFGLLLIWRAEIERGAATAFNVLRGARVPLAVGSAGARENAVWLSASAKQGGLVLCRHTSPNFSHPIHDSVRLGAYLWLPGRSRLGR